MAVREPWTLRHIAVDEPLVKLCGIVDRERFTTIESILHNNGPRLSSVPELRMASQFNVVPGKRVLISAPGYGYCRAEIVRLNTASNNVFVKLIDLGDIITVKTNEVIFFPATSEYKIIEEAPPLSEEYILFGVVKAKQWTKEDMDWARNTIRGTSINTSGEMVYNKPCLKIVLIEDKRNVVSLVDLLVGRGMCRLLTRDLMVNLMYNLFGTQQTNQPFSVPPPLMTSSVGNSFQIPVQQKVSPNMPTINPPGMGRYGSQISPSIPTQSESQSCPRQFDVETLPEGSKHEVYLSHVLDGMNAFTVQLKVNSEEKLSQLMARINGMTPKPFNSALIPGAMCLGKNNLDQVLCRAVVTTVFPENANLYFVDFGHSDIVPFSEIYCIPSAFIQEKVMALRFTLANLDMNLVTKEAESIFEKLVDREEPLLMVVTKPEMPLRQYCDLFIKENGININVKQYILDKVKMMKPAEYKKITFKQKSVANVIITHIDSPIRFFIQLELNQSLMEVLTASVNEDIQTSSMKKLNYSEDVIENMAVCAKYSADDLWYRGLVIDEPDDEGYVSVFFVDYGNEDRVHYSTLRIMNDALISKFPMQAVECRLDVDAKLASKLEVVKSFSKISEEEDSYTMTVMNVLPGNVLLVDLLDSHQRNVKERLMEKFDQPHSMPKLHNTTPPKPSQGNWRDRVNSSNDGSYSAFHAREDGSRSKNAAVDVDELDKSGVSNKDFWNKKNESSQSNGFASEKNTWRGAANRHRSNDDISTSNDRSAYGTNKEDYKRREDDRRPYKKHDSNDWNSGGNHDNDMNGKPSFKRRNDTEDWSSRDNRGPPVRDDYRGGGGRRNDEWNSNRGTDDWKTDNKRNENFEWNSNRGTDDWKTSNNKRNETSDWKTENWKARNDEWASSKPKPRNDDWSGKPRFDNDRSSNWSGKSKFDNGSYSDAPQRRNENNYGDRKSRGDDFGAPSVQLLEEYQKGAELVEAVNEPGHQLKVIVSWFMNPVQFFVKPAEDEEFRKLMESIQSDYPRRKPANVGSLTSNDCVVARHTDNIIYRAKVMRNRPGAVLVNFVDYGNVDIAKQGQVWTINTEHCTIPNQSICCSLRNIIATGESGQWPKNTDFDKYFGENEYTISFVEYREDSASKTWLVDLVDKNGRNIADLLVEDGIATKINVLNNEDLYDLNLLRGQILTVFPGHVESSKKFFVHVEPLKVELIRLAIAKLSEDTNAMKALPIDKIKKGEFCLAPAVDESYYRALIVSVDESTEQARVVYVDYGDEHDVTFVTMRVLPDELMIYNPQMVECALYQGESFTNDVAFEEAISEKDFIIKVMDVVDEKLLVQVYDISGSRLPYPEESAESVQVLCPLPILRRFEKVNVTHIAAGMVYLQRSSDENCICDLCEQLKEKYDEDESDKVKLEPNTFYAAKSARFEAWYRCKLPAPDATEVFYIDYGNTEPIEELLGVKLLDKKFFESPTFAVGVKTNVKFTADDISPLINILSDVTFDATFERNGDADHEWFVELKCAKTGKTLAQFASETNCGELSLERDFQPKPYFAFDNWSVGESRKVVVTHVNSPTSLYVQRADDSEKIASMNESLQSALMKVFPMVGPSEGMGAVRAIDDTKWYRACISNDGKQANAVDFGMTFTKFVAKKLPTKFLDQSNYTVECALDIEPNDGAWTSDVIDRLIELVIDASNADAKLAYIRDDKRWIELKLEITNIAEMLINENLAKFKNHAVIVSHSTSLADFYLHDVANEDELLNFGDKLQEAQKWETIEPILGDLVAAKFIDDDRWYRATVTKIEKSEICVKFVDYGNESTCTEVKKLPDSLKSIPYFASQCTLHPMPEDADDLYEAFVLVDLAHAAKVLQARFFDRNVPMRVALYCDGVSIDNAIRPKPAVESPTQTIAFTHVAVSHINSPSSFYVQPENADLDAIACNLADAVNFGEISQLCVGDIVAAQFPEDGLWYRAKVTKVEDGVNVLFVDYGNGCDVTEYRALPDDVKNIPLWAKHCAFALPQGLERWPELAKGRFDELICEGNTVFEMTIIEDGDPAFVELQDHGVKVADELATLCKADITATNTESTKSIAYISYVNSFDEIWIQTNTPQVDEMQDEMANADAFDTLKSPTEGALVAALYDDDGVWYRAKVIELNNDGHHVLFIDYGNEGTTTNLKSLPEDLVTLPPLAKRCKLQGLPQEMESESTLTKLQGFCYVPFIVAESIEQNNELVVDLRFGKDESKRLVDELLVTVQSTSQEIEKSNELEASDNTETIETSQSIQTTNEIEVETRQISETVETVDESPKDSKTELESETPTDCIAEKDETIDVVKDTLVDPMEEKESADTVTASKTEVDEVVNKPEVAPSVQDKTKCEFRSIVDDLELPTENGKVDVQNVPKSLQVDEEIEISPSTEAKPSNAGLFSIPEETSPVSNSVSSPDEVEIAAPYEDDVNGSNKVIIEDQGEFSNDEDTTSTKFSEDDYFTAHYSPNGDKESSTDEQMPESLELPSTGVVPIAEETAPVSDPTSSPDKGTIPTPREDDANRSNECVMEDQEDTISTKFSEDDEYFTAHSSQIENFDYDTLIADEKIPEFLLEEELLSLNNEFDNTLRSERSTPNMNVSTSTESAKLLVEKRAEVDETGSETIVNDSIPSAEYVEVSNETGDEAQSKSSSVETIEKIDEEKIPVATGEMSDLADEPEAIAKATNVPKVDTVDTSDNVIKSLSEEILCSDIEFVSDKIENYETSFETDESHTSMEPSDKSPPLCSKDNNVAESFQNRPTDQTSELFSLSGTSAVESAVETEKDWRQLPVQMSKILLTTKMKEALEISSSKAGQITSTFVQTYHIVHVNSPGSFYIRRIDESYRLEVMETKLGPKFTTLSKKDVQIDSLVSVNIENRWRRAKVVDIDETRGYWVTCIDYGTENCVNNLYALPAEFATIPPIVLHCGLDLPSEWGHWPNEVCRRFDAMTSEPAQFVIRMNKTEDDIIRVSLFKNRVDVDDILKSMYQCHQEESAVDNGYERELD